MSLIESSLVMKTEGCPTQWFGKTVDDRPVYIRFRWGHLTVYINTEAIGGQFSFREPYHIPLSIQTSDGLDGFMTNEQLFPILKRAGLL